jgi:two-component system sensor histidine kinase YesM
LEIYTKDIKNSHPFCQGNFRISFSNAYFPQYGPYLNVYFPLYSTKTINQVLGYLCFSINDKTLTNISKAGSDSLLLSQQGETITSDPSVYYPQMNQFTNRSGYVTSNGRFYFYTQVPDSTLILVHSIPTGSITRKLPQIAMPLTLLILILLAICLALLKPVIKHAYAPMSALLKAMQEVTTNRNISHRIDCDTFGADFSKIAQGFNAMMEEINSLILQVQEEQKTKEKLRYYMLQSQIKPHFLYNTLECIHWQALADGNKKISKLVLALGSYYKISLSKGAEIISLREELELVRNYLVIQNMRYGNIIENKIEIDEEYLALPIPKITLQPLVENAIYHGIRAKSGNKGSVAITICRQAPFYCLYITDSGSGEANKPAKQLNELLTKENPNAGYGIYNVNKRLQLYYGKTCGLHFIDNSMGGLTVEIKLTWLKTKGEPYV